MISDRTEAAAGTTPTGVVEDPKGLLKTLSSSSSAADAPVLELGSGGQGQWAGAIKADSRALPGVDLVGDVFDVLARIPDGSLSGVCSAHFLEHVEDLRRLLLEIARVLRPGGRMEAIVPHFSNPWFYSDPTHHSFFGLYTLSYLMQDGHFKRRVPQYDEPVPLRIVGARLTFKPRTRGVLSKVVNGAAGKLFNASTRFQEMYEANLCWVLPCYEIHFEVERE